MHGWVRTSARLTVAEHDVKLYGTDPAAISRRTVTVRWPAVFHLLCLVAEARSGAGWAWAIYAGKGRLVEKGDAKKESGARAAVIRRVKTLVEETRKNPEIAELERAAVEPVIALGYSRTKPQLGTALQRDGTYAEVAVSTEEQARRVLDDGLAGLKAMREGAAKAGFKL